MFREFTLTDLVLFPRAEYFADDSKPMILETENYYILADRNGIEIGLTPEDVHPKIGKVEIKDNKKITLMLAELIAKKIEGKTTEEIIGILRDLDITL